MSQTYTLAEFFSSEANSGFTNLHAEIKGFRIPQKEVDGDRYTEAKLSEEDGKMAIKFRENEKSRQLFGRWGGYDPSEDHTLTYYTILWDPETDKFSMYTQEGLTEEENEEGFEEYGDEYEYMQEKKYYNPDDEAETFEAIEAISMLDFLPAAGDFLEKVHIEGYLKNQELKKKRLEEKARKIQEELAKLN
jgi:hypothetical protein